jgi:AraC-like DNA-binding protein
LIATSLIQLLLAFAFLATILNFLVIPFVEREALADGERIVRLIQKAVDRQLETMNDITAALIYNPAFMPYTLREEPFDAIEARAILKTVAVANPLMEAIGTSYYRDEFLLTSQTSALKSRYFRSIGVDADEMESAEALDRGYVVTDRNLVFLIRMGSSSRTAYGYFFYLFDKETLLNGLFPDSDSNRYVSLSSRDGTVFVENRPRDLDPDRFVRSEFDSESTGIRYTFFTSVEGAEALLRSMLVLFLISFLSALALGIAIVFGFSRFNYSPVRRLAAILNIDTPSSNQDEGEFDRIEHTLNSLIHFDNNPSEIHRIEVMNLRRTIAGKSINGKYRDRDDFVKDLKSADVYSVNRYFGFVRVLVSQQDQDSTLAADFSTAKGGMCCVNDRIDRNQALFLLSCRRTEDAESILVSFCTQQQEEPRPLLTVGAGRLSDNPSDLSQSFLDATAALEYRLVRGLGRIIMYESIPAPEQINLTHVESLLQSLHHAINSVDRKSLRASVGKILDYCADLSLSGARYVNWNLIRTVRETMGAFALSNHEQRILDDFSVSSLTEFETIEELASYVTRNLESIAQLVDDRTPTRSEVLCQQVKAHIEENLGSPELSLSGIAAQFGMSQGHLCRVFKESEHRTILSIIKEGRYARACEMLRESDLAVIDIVRQVGYSDPASFNREFKKRYALTPGQYRESFASAKDDTNGASPVDPALPSEVATQTGVRSD